MIPKGGFYRLIQGTKIGRNEWPIGKIEEKAIAMVKLEASAIQAIRSFLAEKGIQGPLRIDLRSNGCCDPSLLLSVSDVRESDLIQEVEGLTFVMSPEIYRLAGEVTISYADEIGKKGFLLTPEKPISEWDGFGISDIRF